MAEEVQIGGGDPGIAKIRNPVGTGFLMLIPFYGLYWWYQVNREMVDLGQARNAEGLGDNPMTSLLALFPGGLIIVPAIMTLFNGTQRMKLAQEVTTGAPPTLNGWIVLVFLIIFSPIAYGYMQAELNKAWEALPSAAVGPGEPASQIEQPQPASEARQEPPPAAGQ